MGNALWNACQLASPQLKLRYWRDAAGPEIDFVIEQAQEYIPVEVKWTEAPTSTDAKNLMKFIDEYSAKKA